MVEVQMSPSDRQQFLQYVSHRDQRQRQAQELQRSGTRGPLAGTGQYMQRQSQSGFGQN